MAATWWQQVSPLPTGEQFALARDEQRAVVTEVGAALRSYQVAGRELLDGFAPDAMPAGSRGQVLLPWPNRVDGGAYTFDGQRHQLPLNEPTRQNAIHGLTRWQSWQPIERAPSHITLGLVLRPQPGYPFTLALSVGYTLADAGLVVRTSAHNLGGTPAPFGAGQHPYFQVGTARVDEALLHLPAAQWLRTNERLIPSGRAEVAGTALDFRAERALGAQALDTCFTDLVRDAAGQARITLAHPDGAPRLSVVLDAAYQYVQVFSGDTLSDVAARRRALAIEPMTCAPDAFNNGEGLRVLAPGETFSTSWQVSVTSSGRR